MERYVGTDSFLTDAEVMKELRVSKMTLWNLRKKRPDFPKKIYLGNSPRTSAKDLEAWMLSQRGNSPEPLNVKETVK
jgi:predicted DNA-binding transcriptional regulator AlpA